MSRVQRRRYSIDALFPEQQVRVIRAELDACGWRECDDDSWDAHWKGQHPELGDFLSLAGRRFNRLPGAEAFTLKSHLSDNVLAARRWSGDATPGIHARGFWMPDDRAAWLEAAADAPDSLWLRKPTGLSRGQGIQLVSDPTDVPDEPDWMVQEYIENPHLLHGHKYVLRRYLLVTSLDPLICYLHRSGVCKLASRPFTLDPASLSDPFVHLTNPPVQKANEEVPWGSQNSDLEAYREQLRSMGIDDEMVFGRIADAVTKVAIACREQAGWVARQVPGGVRGCFQLFGVDILVDDTLNPWILECNQGPVMSVSAEYDPQAAAKVRAAKDSAMRDTLSLLGFLRPVADAPDPQAPDYWAQRLEFEAEGAGGFDRVWPRSDATEFLPWFPLPRPADVRALEAVGYPGPTGGWAIPRPRPDYPGFAMESGLAVFAEDQQRFFWLDDAAAMVWLSLAEGLTPEEIAQDWATLGDRNADDALNDVWDLCSAWAQRGLLQGMAAPDEATPAVVSDHERGPAVPCTWQGPLAVIDLRHAGSTLPDEGGPVLPLTPAPEPVRVVFLVEGDEPSLQARSTEVLLDRVLDPRFSKGRISGRRAAALVEWADSVQAFDLSGDPTVHVRAHAALLSLVIGS